MVYGDMAVSYTHAVPTIGGNLRQIRRALELTQAGLSSLAGVQQSNISGWEKNQKEPTVTSLLRVARALGCTIDDLVKGVDETYDANVAAMRAGDPVRVPIVAERPGPRSPGAHLVLDVFEESDESDREVLLATARALRSAARRRAPKASTRGGHPGPTLGRPTEGNVDPKRRAKKS